MKWAVRRSNILCEGEEVEFALSSSDDDILLLSGSSDSPLINLFKSREEAFKEFEECVRNGDKPSLSLHPHWCLTYTLVSVGMYDDVSAEDEDAELPNTTTPLGKNATPKERFYDYLWSCEWFRAEDTHIECFDHYLTKREEWLEMVRKDDEDDDK